MRPDDERDPEPMQPNETPDASNDMSLALIEEQADHKIRRVLHDGRWFFSVVDVISILTDSPRPRVYWGVLKGRLREEGAGEVFTNCKQLKMKAADGKQRETDGADTETMLRIVQSIPSPKAEPIKQWLAREGAKRLEEQAHPLDPAEAKTTRGRLTMPEWDAPAMEWVDYHEQMAILYRRQYAFAAQLRMAQDDIVAQGEQLEMHDEWLDEHAQRLEGHDTRLDDHDAQMGDMRTRMDRLEDGQRQLPDLLLRMGPQALTPAHQSQVKTWAVRLHDLGGFAFPTIYGELNTHFHVGKYSDIADAEWEAVAAWFRVRLDAAEKRHNA